MKKTLIIISLVALPILYALFVFLTQINNLAIFDLLLFLMVILINLLMEKRRKKQKIISVCSAAIVLTFSFLLQYTQYNITVFIVGTVLLVAFALIIPIIERSK